MKNQVVVSLAIVAATIVWMIIPRGAETTADAPESDDMSVIAVPEGTNIETNPEILIVRVSRIDPQSYVEQVRVRGRTQASRHVQVRAEEAGRIVSQPVARAHAWPQAMCYAKFR